MFRATLARLADEYEGLEAQNADLSEEITKLRLLLEVSEEARFTDGKVLQESMIASPQFEVTKADEETDDEDALEISQVASHAPLKLFESGQDIDDIVLTEKASETTCIHHTSTSSLTNAITMTSPPTLLSAVSSVKWLDEARDSNRQKVGRSSSFGWKNLVSAGASNESLPCDELSAWLTTGSLKKCPGDSGTESFSLTGTGTPQRKLCMIIDPLSKTKLVWDAFMFVFILIDAWLTPFELLYLADSSRLIANTLDVTSHSLTVLFVVDMVLNFCTGYVDLEIMEKVMDSIAIVKRYLRFWFWIDLFATVPWDLLLSVGSSSKALRALRCFKLLRMTRLFRMVQLLTSSARYHVWGDILLHTLKALILLLVVHMHAFIWALLQLESVSVETVPQSLSLYAESFAWAFRAFTTGVTGANASRGEESSVVVFEAVIAAERLVLFFLLGGHIMTACLPSILRESTAVPNYQILSYLNERSVSFRTQTKVLLSLRDTRHAQRCGDSIEAIVKISRTLPEELQQKIHIEMWSTRLMSLQLLQRVANWALGFSEALSEIVSEAIHPSHTILFKEGSAATTAYHIISGEVRLTRSAVDFPLQEFLPGMWIGENSLLSAALRYPASCVMTCLTSLMVLRGKDFQRIVSRFDLTHAFQEFCSEELWRGICGRCGSLGDHFSDTCPTAPTTNRFKRKISRRFFQGESSLDWCSESSLGGLAVDLSQFLKAHDLMFLWPVLQEHFSTVKNLQAFQELVRNNIDELCSYCTDWEDADMNPAELRILLRSETFNDFESNRMRGVREALFHEVSSLQHLIFLSHYKLEAGTEAALIRTEFEQAMRQDSGSLGHCFDEPVFLDSDSLSSLDDLRDRVDNTHNLVILLTENVLTRPWVLVEIITARRRRAQIIPVSISRVGSQFTFPDDTWFERFRDGELLNEEAKDLLQKYDCGIHEVADAIEAVFQQIALPYSPHKAKSIRKAEIAAILGRCKLRNGVDVDTYRMSTAMSKRNSIHRNSTIQPPRHNSLWDGICSDATGVLGKRGI